MSAEGGRLLVYETLGSTQDEALAQVQAGWRDVVGVRTDYQAAGRGRHGARWVAPPRTCLLVTYILYGEDCRPDEAGRLAFLAAVALADAIEAQTGLSPAFKWPNDILLAGRKTAGILIETTALHQDHRRSQIASRKSEWAALIGIGLNVNVERFPPELERTATSLFLEAGSAFSVEALEEAVRAALFSVRETAAQRGFAWLLDRWRARDATPGLRFQAVVDGRSVEGAAAGVGESGALILRLDSGASVEVFAATSLKAL